MDRMQKLLVLLLLASSIVVAQSPVQRAEHGAAGLQTHYDEATGLYRDTDWWNAANAITALADTALLTHSKEHNATFANTFAKAQAKHPNFLNEYYDDEGWWALAWVRVYDVTHDARYLTMSQSIFQDMAGGWADTCGGGIWWKKDVQYKNAIANELFFSVATSLAVRTSDPQYRQWAQREWKWFRASGMINGDNLVNDGLDKQCKNNGRTTWTYNQGVLLNGLNDLAKLAADASLLDEANRIATATMTRLVDSQGILHDSCEPPATKSCGADGTQFKGIFVRNLAALPQTPQSRAFLQHNADTLWNDARRDGDQFGEVWDSETLGVVNGSTQSSALDLLNAAARVR